MPEPTPVEGAQVTPEVKSETPAIKLDPSTPLTQQTKVLDKLLVDEPKDEPKEELKEDSKADPKTDEPKEGEPAKQEVKEDEPKERVEEPKDEPDLPIEEPKELPPVAKYILDNLPEIQVIGHTENGKEQLFKVKRAEDLPEDFEFSSRRAELIFNAAIASQELNARELLGKYQAQQQQQQVQEFKNQQALDVQADIAALQKEGVLPKFKYANTDPQFDSDPAVKEANEIYELFEKTNQAYIDSKRTYRISYRDAADKYYAQKSRTAPKEEPKEEPKAPSKADQERREVADKIGARQGADPSQSRRTLPAGATLKDVLKAYNNGAI